MLKQLTVGCVLLSSLVLSLRLAVCLFALLRTEGPYFGSGALEAGIRATLSVFVSQGYRMGELPPPPRSSAPP